jgi:hypothetical protein
MGGKGREGNRGEWKGGKRERRKERQRKRKKERKRKVNIFLRNINNILIYYVLDLT